MSKFKVGDKVRIKLGDGFILWTKEMHKLVGKIMTVSETHQCNSHSYFSVSENRFNWNDCDAELVEQPRREFIVIHRDGNVMTAEHRVNRDVIKSEKATCAPSDTFDFETGAKIAFDRLMNRQNIEEAVKAWNEPAPQPAHRFKVGDRVDNKKHGVGVVKEINDSVISWIPYWVVFEDHAMWLGDDSLSHAPAPEPPKFYTGKVACISGEYGVGRIFTVKDGFFADRQYNCPEKPYKSVDDMNDRFLFGKFAKAKE